MSRIILPSHIIIRRFPCTMASFMLCVTISAVRLCSAIILSESSRTFAAVFGSSAAVCSSSRSSLGFFSVAIRRVSACLCPPESRPTFARRRVSSPKSSGFRSSTYSSLSFFVIPHLRVRVCPRRFATARFSSISISAAVPFMGSWNTRPRYFALLCSGSFVISSPSMITEPLSTGQTPAMAFSMVDFPAPLPPMIVTKSPSSSVRLMPFKALFSLIEPGLKVL